MTENHKYFRIIMHSIYVKIAMEDVSLMISIIRDTIFRFLLIFLRIILGEHTPEFFGLTRKSKGVRGRPESASAMIGESNASRRAE